MKPFNTNLIDCPFLLLLQSLNLLLDFIDILLVILHVNIFLNWVPQGMALMLFWIFYDSLSQIDGFILDNFLFGFHSFLLLFLLISVFLKGLQLILHLNGFDIVKFQLLRSRMLGLEATQLKLLLGQFNFRLL